MQKNWKWIYVPIIHGNKERSRFNKRKSKCSKSIFIRKAANQKIELKKIKKCSELANKFNIEVHAGHGMDYKTAKIIKKVKFIKEFNIGHFIIGESVLFGMNKVIKNFKKIIR